MTLKNDLRIKFERKYTAKFTEMASDYGIAIDYEKDRAALDKGLHLTEVTEIAGDEYEGVTSIRVWFQFKGKSAKSFSRGDFDKHDYISESIEIDHLRQWYKYAEPVYLTLYIESVDQFFAVDIKQVIDNRWGDSVLKNETFIKSTGKKKGSMPGSVSIRIPKSSLIDEEFWQRLFEHRSMRIDGNEYKGVPLPHSYDINSRQLVKMDPELYVKVVEDLLAAHRYRVENEHDAYQLYPGSIEAGDVLKLTTGIMFDSYELIPFLTSELIPDEKGYRAEGQTFKVQGECAVLIHSKVESLPDTEILHELFQTLEKQGTKALLVFVNHYFLEASLLGEKGYNCFPHYSQAASGTNLYFVPPQHLNDLGRNILVATNVYLKYREHLRWQDEEVARRLERGEIKILPNRF